MCARHLVRSRSRLGPRLVLAIAAFVTSVLGCAKDDRNEASAPHAAPPATRTASGGAPTPDVPHAGSAAPGAPSDSFVEVTAATFAPTLASRPERVLLVNVWSTWCDPCVEEMPELVRVARAYAPRGLGLVLVSADPRSQRDAAKAFLNAQGAPLPRYVKTGPDDAFVGAVHASWSGALPVTVLYDSERRARHLFGGRVDVHALERALETMLPAAGSEPGESR